MKLSVSNLVVAIFEQLSHRGALRNIFVTHNAFGIFSRYSHIARRPYRQAQGGLSVEGHGAESRRKHVQEAQGTLFNV